MKLSLTERLFLSNQYRVLEKLYPEEADTYSRFQKVLEHGFEMHYQEMFQNLDEETFTREQSKEVLDILSMYQEMNDCFDKLDDQSGIDASLLKFRGFDGNNEPEQLSYARFYVEDQGHFSRLGINELNSHSMVLGMYRRMLGEYRKVQHSVNKDDVIRILAARIHPDYRE